MIGKQNKEKTYSPGNPLDSVISVVMNSFPWESSEKNRRKIQVYRRSTWIFMIIWYYLLIQFLCKPAMFYEKYVTLFQKICWYRILRITNGTHNLKTRSRVSRKPKTTVFWCVYIAIHGQWTPFTPYNFCTRQLLQQTTFAPGTLCNFYTRHLLHQTIFTTNNFYTRHPLQRLH